MSLCLHLLSQSCYYLSTLFFFFNDPPTTEIYTLSLHDALPISMAVTVPVGKSLNTDEATLLLVVSFFEEVPSSLVICTVAPRSEEHTSELSHVAISYAVFCLKKKKRLVVI